MAERKSPKTRSSLSKKSLSKKASATTPAKSGSAADKDQGTSFSESETVETVFEASPTESEEGNRIPVLVEMRIPVSASASMVLEKAAAFGATSLELDTDYEPIPVSAPDEVTKAMDVAREQSVIIRGFITPDKVADLKKEPEVVDVYPDTTIAPFNEQSESHELLELVDSAALEDCAIPPCDCTPSTPKGTLAEVAQKLEADQLWATGHRGQGIVVGVVDGGLSAQGRVSDGEIPRVIGGWPSDWGTRADWGRHGNMSGTDVLGIAPLASLHDIRIAGSSSTISQALAGFQWAINHYRSHGTPQILTNSWGIYQKAWDPEYAEDPNHPFTRKVIEAISEGILVLFAAGNCGEACPSGRCESDSGPGKSIWGANGHPAVMTVGAANTRDELIGYSSQGPAALDDQKPDFCAISHFKGYFPVDTGTSAACPIAAGVIALLKQRQPTLSQTRAKTILKQTAKNIGPSGWDQHSGAGVIRAKTAFDQLLPVTPVSHHKALADKALAKYRETGDLRYLCLYYHYYAEHFRNRHEYMRDWADLARYYRLKSLYYACVARISDKPIHTSDKHRYMALYWRVCFENTQKRSYQCAYFQELRDYFRSLFRIRPDHIYLRAANHYASKYERCVS
jgi:subtilisin family serine protease